MPRSTRKAFDIARLAIATTVVIVVAWLCSVAGVIGFAVYEGAQVETRRPIAEAIVVLGAAQYAGKPSPVLKARIDHALSLWQEGVAETLVFTGGTGTGDTTSEAVVSAAYARKHDIPDRAIMLESAGRTTSESMHGVAALLRARGAHSVVLVSDRFHMFRLWLLARRMGLTARTSPTRTSPIAASVVTNTEYIFSESLKALIAFFIE